MADDAERIDWMLTTVDNPFDPFTQFREWYAYDMDKGYHTPALLDRVAYMSDELSDADQRLAIEEAIDEIVRENVSGMHRKVAKRTLVSP